MRLAVATALTLLVLAAPARATHTYSHRAEVGFGVVKLGGHSITYWRKKALGRTRQVRRLQGALRSEPVGGHWLERAFLCIQRFEGSWRDPHAPYYGGLQMDWSFMRAYGSPFLRAFGPATFWPVSVQLAVAIHAYVSGRGFGPWPSTSRSCGLR